MKFSRWIVVPLFLALSYGLLSAWASSDLRLNNFLKGFVIGAVMGLILQIWSYNRTKGISHTNTQGDFSIKQKQSLVVLLNLEEAFDECKKSVNSLKSAYVKSESLESGFIKAKTKMNFHSFGTEIIFNLSSVNENLTEIEISTHPIVKGTMVDYGESLKIIEKVIAFLKERDSEINQKLLVESAAILDNVYVKPFQKEKVER